MKLSEAIYNMADDLEDFDIGDETEANDEDLQTVGITAPKKGAKFNIKQPDQVTRLPGQINQTYQLIRKMGGYWKIKRIK
mgnify:CR=1 FL=1